MNIQTLSTNQSFHFLFDARVHTHVKNFSMHDMSVHELFWFLVKLLQQGVESIVPVGNIEELTHKDWDWIVYCFQRIGFTIYMRQCYFNVCDQKTPLSITFYVEEGDLEALDKHILVILSKRSQRKYNISFEKLSVS